MISDMDCCEVMCEVDCGTIALTISIDNFFHTLTLRLIMFLSVTKRCVK